MVGLLVPKKAIQTGAVALFETCLVCVFFACGKCVEQRVARRRDLRSFGEAGQSWPPVTCPQKVEENSGGVVKRTLCGPGRLKKR